MFIDLNILFFLHICMHVYVYKYKMNMQTYIMQTNFYSESWSNVNYI